MKFHYGDLKEKAVLRPGFNRVTDVTVCLKRIGTRGLAVCWDNVASNVNRVAEKKNAKNAPVIFFPFAKGLICLSLPLCFI